MRFNDTKKDCNHKMDIDGNIECGHRRKIISGLNGCLCREDNCYKHYGGHDTRRGNDMRKLLSQFAQTMEEKLQKHDDLRGEAGWMSDDCSVTELMDRMKTELGEAETAYEDCDEDMLMGECTDIANFAMMIATRIANRRSKK